MTGCGCHSHNGFQLSPEGLAPRESYRDYLDRMDMSLHLDSRVSVSGLGRDGDRFVGFSDEEIDEQARRFHHGW